MDVPTLTPASRVSRIRLYVATAALALTVAGGMAYGLITGTHLTANRASLVEAVLSIKVEATIAHLWFEEIIAGDRNEDIDQVWGHLTVAKRYADAMLHGDTVEGLQVYPLERPALRTRISDIRTKLDAFENVARHRLDVFDLSGPGTQVDQAFDAIFDTFLAESDEVQAYLKQAIHAELARFQDAMEILLVLSLLLGASVCWMFFRFNARQDAAMSSIRVADTKLREQAEKLTRSNQELEQFAYVASHDLREPLRKIQAFGDLLNEEYGDRLDEDGRTYITRMQRGAERLQALIEGLLSYSRMSTRAQPFEVVILDDVVGEIVSDLEPRITARKARVEVAALPEVMGDRLQLTQLFQNLIANALKFHPPDRAPHVRVWAERDGSHWCFRVADDGIGIDGAYRDKIFGVFQRLHGRHEYEGTGVGLSICKKAVVYHGGTIDFVSAAGRGTTFEVRIPVGRTEPTGQ